MKPFCWWSLLITILLNLVSCGGNSLEKRVKAYKAEGHYVQVNASKSFILHAKNRKVYLDNLKEDILVSDLSAPQNVVYFSIADDGSPKMIEKQEAIVLYSSPIIISDWGYALDSGGHQNDYLYLYKTQKYYTIGPGAASRLALYRDNVPKAFLQIGGRLTLDLESIEKLLTEEAKDYFHQKHQPSGIVSLRITKTGDLSFDGDYVKIDDPEIQSTATSLRTGELASKIASIANEEYLAYLEKVIAAEREKFLSLRRERKAEIREENKQNAIEFMDVVNSYNNSIKNNRFLGQRFIMTAYYDKIARSNRSGFKYVLVNNDWGRTAYLYTNDEYFREIDLPTKVCVVARYIGRKDENAMDITDLFSDSHRAEWAYYFEGYHYGDALEQTYWDDAEPPQALIQKITSFYQDYGSNVFKVESIFGTTPDFDQLRRMLEYDVFTGSQDPDDHYTVSVTKSRSMEHGFDVKWKEQNGENENIHLVWIFEYEDGQWVLDDILQ